MKINNIILIILFSLSLINCNNKQELTPSEYIKWIKEDNTLKKEKRIGDYIYNIQYIPNDFSILKTNKNISLHEYNKQIRKLRNYISFIFKVKMVNAKISPLKNNVTSNEEFSMRLQYCSYEINNDFLLVIGNDTLPCVNSIFERNYNVSPYNTFVLNFEIENDLKKIDSDLLLIYDDYMWENGIIKFRIKKIDLNKIPKLKII